MKIRSRSRRIPSAYAAQGRPKPARRIELVPDDLKPLPANLRERAIALMLELNDDPPEHPLTPEKAAAWIDYEVYRQNWHAGRVEHRGDNSDHPEVGPHKPTGRNVWPHPDAWVGTRDLDASLAIWRTLDEAGEDPKTYWGGRAPTKARTAAPAPRGDRDLLALVVGSPFLIIGYGIAACFTTIPLYVLLAAVSDSYTILPDTEREIGTAGAIVAVLTAWYFISGVSRALRGRSA
jgi:hypothetical protein